MSNCPLGYDCNSMNGSIEGKCGNQETCENWGLSWGLPYKYLDICKAKIMIVQCEPKRYHWAKEMETTKDIAAHCNIDWMETGYYYRAVNLNPEENIDYKEIIRREWEEEKWAKSVPNIHFIETGEDLIYANQSNNVKALELKKAE